jgi:hypothetical protein
MNGPKPKRYPWRWALMPQERGIGQWAPQPKTRQTPPQPQCSGFQGHAGVDDDDAPEWAR